MHTRPKSSNIPKCDSAFTMCRRQAAGSGTHGGDDDEQEEASSVHEMQSLIPEDDKRKERAYRPREWIGGAGRCSRYVPTSVHAKTFPSSIVSLILNMSKPAKYLYRPYASEKCANGFSGVFSCRRLTCPCVHIPGTSSAGARFISRTPKAGETELTCQIWAQRYKKILIGLRCCK